jgi:hypothetical protein
MNVLATDKRAQILNCLVEGCSMRSTSRLTGAAKKTVERMLVAAGEACAAYMDKTMRGLNCKLLQVDEIWSFTYSKQKNVPEDMRGRKDVGDTWTWVAIDAQTKLIPCWHVGKRGARDAYQFINDLAARLAGRVQLTSDGHKGYLDCMATKSGHPKSATLQPSAWARGKSASSDTPTASTSAPATLNARTSRCA